MARELRAAHSRRPQARQGILQAETDRLQRETVVVQSKRLRPWIPSGKLLARFVLWAEVTVLFHYLVKVAAKEDKAVMVDMSESLVGAQRAEELMGTLAEELIADLGEKYFEQGRQKGQAEGLAKGRAEDILRILAVRGVRMDDIARQRILSCTDLNTLGLWLERAAKATHISEVLEDPKQ